MSEARPRTDVEHVRPDDERLVPLFEERVAELSVIFAGVVGHPADPVDDAEVAPPRGTFVLVSVDGAAAACGALRPFQEEGTAEIKRMFVTGTHRRRGLGRIVLEELESFARDAGYTAIRLETGTLQPDAIAFYTANGYRTIPCYGQWSGYELSVCMEKALSAERPRR